MRNVWGETELARLLHDEVSNQHPHIKEHPGAGAAGQ